MNNQTAIVIGATGATGTELVTQLLNNSNFAKVKILIRKDITLSHPKLEKHIVDFEKLENWKEFISGDVLFSALGTTLKLAGSKENQYKIDFTYQYTTAKIAAENGVKSLVLVSAYGANPKSNIFYSRMKGELEEAIKKLNFEKVHIFKPGILDRAVQDDRNMERVSLKIIKAINKIGLFTSQKPMPVSILAEKMIKVSLTPTGKSLNDYMLQNIFLI